MAREVHIRVSLWDAGCLRPLLSRAIEDTERLERVRGDGLSEEAANDIKLYRAQLRGCLAAVERVLS